MMIRMLTIGQLPEALAMANDLFDKEMAPYVSAGRTMYPILTEGDIVLLNVFI